MIEDKGYSYILYDYNKDTKEIEEKYAYEGTQKIEITNYIECKECQYYIEHYGFHNMDIFEILQNQGKGRKDEKQK